MGENGRVREREQQEREKLISRQTNKQTLTKLIMNWCTAISDMRHQKHRAIYETHYISAHTCTHIHV